MSVGRNFGHKTPVGGLVSSAAIVPYTPKFAFLGMVIVHPEYRRLGGDRRSPGFHARQQCRRLGGHGPQIVPGRQPEFRAHGTVALQAMHAWHLPLITSLDTNRL